MRSLLAVWIATIAACTPTQPIQPTTRSAAASPAYPLLDAHCDEYAALPVERHAVTSGVELFLFQDRDYVWLCYTVPPDVFGALDLVLAAPAVAEPVNLHVSAQLGEWSATNPDAAPKDPASSLWWNQRGWSALPVPFNGTRDDGKIKFRPTPGRELQLSKSRFGRGTWRLRMQIYGVGADGRDARFPISGEHALSVW